MSLPNAENLYQELLKKLKEHYSKEAFQLAGLASGGAWIAERLAKDMGHKDFGVINVSFHRDDYQDKGVRAFKSAEGMATKIPFDVNGANIVMVDDVLDTGRTVRAALNELFDYGRPAKVDLAVLADRHRRQLPVDATFKGAKVDIPANQILVLEQNPDTTFAFSTEIKESH
ncbi:bifunctional pyr operon transcriptional regulator/uracil phosphoribosyltransferase PyrR [Polynucleobacter sp. MWH-Loch1C5]|uniref:bifunctional pyr operon transcriptional regulator/uracil phosphoribosyltransferase PyrR n=1 Tax=Polynucleobacter sp. MWH-Loch1C5 TaxID=2689108 RepID=UPI001C0B40E9|nr:bifunctional pyr operon transcriptional regulator/uracil phosphoribosyltransferase PyrR [Polynucleobacter sp. MWH-Loch1C5]MBU3542226.1 bifunctional pyr operon transcriptional regulator/uracil phosphoribosyltransferase PyrR [Polynucleobacter sp. MWH-Loch1C5]